MIGWAEERAETKRLYELSPWRCGDIYAHESGLRAKIWRVERPESDELVPILRLFDDDGSLGDRWASAAQPGWTKENI